MAEKPLTPQQPTSCAVCFANATPLDEQVYREPAYPQIAFHLDHLFDEKASLKCRIHKSEILGLHCDACNVLMCYTCSMHGEHRYHMCRHADTKFEELKRVLTPLQEQSTRALQKASEMVAGLNHAQDQLMQQTALAQREIEQTFQRVQELVEKRRKEVLAQLEELSRQHEKSIASDKGGLNSVRVSISGCLDSVKKNLVTGSIAGVSELVAIAVKDISQLNIDTDTPPDIQSTISHAALAGGLQTWRVYADDVCPENCFTDGQGVNAATLNTVAEFDLYTRNYDSNPCAHPVDCQNIECELFYEGNNASFKGNVRSGEGGHYLVSYTPRLSGNHSLHLRVGGKNVRGSPFKVTVRDVRRPIATITEVRGPWGVATNQEGQTIVAENKGNCISIFDSNKKKVNCIGLASNPAPPKPDAEEIACLNHPSEIAVDRSGDILVANRHQHTVLKFKPDGTLVKTVGMGDKEKLFYPTGISINPINQKVYVTNALKHSVSVLNSDLSHDFGFGRHGDQKGVEFVYPTSVACDSTGLVYVVDSGNSRIQVFSASGEHKNTFGHFGCQDGELNRPVGIAIDSKDKLYVSDRGNHRICVFTHKGGFVTAFYSTAEDTFDPSALAVDNSGVLYVCSFKQGDVQLFQV